MNISNGRTSIHISGRTGNVYLGGNGTNGDLFLTDTDGQTIIHLDGETGHAAFGGNGEDGKIILKDSLGETSISLEANSGNTKLTGDLTLNTITLQGNMGSAILGGNGEDGELTLNNSADQTTVSLDGNAGSAILGGSGQSGDLRLRNQSGQATISMSGEAGDISFLNAANCAVDFNVVDFASAEPGTVMVMVEDGQLRQSDRSFDKRVVGVVSGAKDTQSGIVLDRQIASFGRKPIAVMGKVFCKVDATLAPIEVGDLLTTSPTAGHAMKADNPNRAFGAVIGKALSTLRSGTGLMPVLITLQ